MPSCMQRIGTPNARHNFDNKYRAKLENVDPPLSKYNEVLQRKSVNQIYEEKLQPAFDAFNKRQKRKDRRLDVKYNCTTALEYQHALDKKARESKNAIDQKGRPPIREIIWQFGNPEQGFGCRNQTTESRQRIKEMLWECHAEAERRYPQLIFGDCVFHADEVSFNADGKEVGSLHLHDDIVPLCYKNKQGPDVQVAFERCLREMGFSTFENWKHDLDNIMETVLERHGLERILIGNTEQHQESGQWHRQQRAIKETKELENKRTELQQAVDDLQTTVEITRETLEDLQEDVFFVKEEAANNEELAMVYLEQANEARQQVVAAQQIVRDLQEETQSLDNQLQEKNLDFQKAVGETIETQLECLPERIDRKPILMNKEKVIVSTQDLDALERRAEYVSAAKETESSVRTKAAGIISQAEAQAAQIQLDAQAAAERIKQAQQQAWGEIDAEKERLRQRSRKLDAEEMKYFQAAGAMRENPQLKHRIRALETELNKQISNDDRRINAAVEKATQPLREQLQARDKDISVLKATISNLQQKLQDVTQTAAALISAIKYVAERFAGKITGAILDATARRGELWMVNDGFPEYGKQAAILPKAISKELKLDLEYIPNGKDGKGVYTSSGTLVANVASLQDACERFPQCLVSLKSYERER